MLYAFAQFQTAREHGMVYAVEMFEEFCFCSNECVVIEEIEVLKNEKHTFIGKRKRSNALFQIAMNISMADFVVEIIDAHLNEIADITICIGRNELVQYAVMVLRAVNQMVDFERIPVFKICFAAYETA